MKYTNLEELATAYKSGELDRSDEPLIIDNDDTYVYGGEGQVFNGGAPIELLQQALNALGIPWQPA